ncbi:hypothetical protein LTR17_019998 [Elasticomyces elasticus]|nr:hypothetical protein LTR17_019998 [Elasticomyces elasticus]
MAPEQQPTWEWPGYTKTIHRSVYGAIDPTNPDNSTAGKVVVVTGGGAGVGAEIAKSFVRSGSKAVVILGRRESVLSAAKKNLEALGSSKILTYAADVVDEAGLNSAFTATEEAVGKVDIVVACAGFMPEVVPAAIAEIGDWWEAFEVNVRGLLLTFRAWMPHKSNSTPSFIYVNAAGAHFAPVPGLSGYSPSKIAAASLIGHLQAENPDLHITNFHPGILETPMATKSQFAVTRDDISLPAGFAVWLASPAASWTGGRFLWAHWDVDELIAMKDEIALGNELVMTLNGWPKQVDIVVKA